MTQIMGLRGDRTGQDKKRSLEARAGAFSRLKSEKKTNFDFKIYFFLNQNKQSIVDKKEKLR